MSLKKISTIEFFQFEKYKTNLTTVVNRIVSSSAPEKLVKMLIRLKIAFFMVFRATPLPPKAVISLPGASGDLFHLLGDHTESEKNPEHFFFGRKSFPKKYFLENFRKFWGNFRTSNKCWRKSKSVEKIFDFRFFFEKKIQLFFSKIKFRYEKYIIVVRDYFFTTPCGCLVR